MAAGVALLLLVLPAFLGGNRVFNGNRSSLTSSTTGILERCFPPRDTTSFCSGTVDVPLLADRSSVVYRLLVRLGCSVVLDGVDLSSVDDDFFFESFSSSS